MTGLNTVSRGTSHNMDHNSKVVLGIFGAIFLVLVIALISEKRPPQ
jgi:hypothetical protein